MARLALRHSVDGDLARAVLAGAIEVHGAAQCNVASFRSRL
jgi:hypothetical protein